MKLLIEFKPALLFLGKFLLLYFVGNILYGVFIESYGNRPDPATRFVTRQTSAFLEMFGYNTSLRDHTTQPTIILKNEGSGILDVFEGCNGINVIIVFASFLFAFGGPKRWLVVFLPLGIIIIHLFNLFRISLLFSLALNNSAKFYYYHKYFFTAILYIVVFALWVVWVIRFNEKRNIKATA